MKYTIKNRFIPFGESIRAAVDPAELKICHRVSFAHVPFEIVIYNGQLPPIDYPLMRRFATNLFGLDGNIVDAPELASRPEKYLGTYGHNNLQVQELYADEGDDGHTLYQFVGWVLLLKSEVARLAAAGSDRWRVYHEIVGVGPSDDFHLYLDGIKEDR